MSDLRQAAQQALEALEGGADSWQLVGPAIDALKAALAESVQEPAGQLQEEAFGRGQVLWFKKPPDLSMLYTAPPQRKPLTEEEIDSVWDSEKAFADIYAIVRAIERAHGIGGQP